LSGVDQQQTEEIPNPVFIFYYITQVATNERGVFVLQTSFRESGNPENVVREKYF
jgi:hypothetical protein